jgi:soluble lytic murein transglycosylase-like protein
VGRSVLTRWPRLTGRTLVIVAVLGACGSAHAERLVFTSGRTLQVKSYRADGRTMVVMLPSGGEATFDAAIVAAIEPDEIAPEIAAPPSAVPAPSPVSDEHLQSRPFAELISNVASKHGVAPALVHAVIRAESNYQPRARSQAGARGLMQVMPSTALEFGVRNLYDPHANLEAGVQYLKTLLTRFTLTDALAAYNAGPATVKKYGGVPPFAETRDYVKKVLADFPQ